MKKGNRYRKANEEEEGSLYLRDQRGDPNAGSRAHHREIGHPPANHGHDTNRRQPHDPDRDHLYPVHHAQRHIETGVSRTASHDQSQSHWSQTTAVSHLAFGVPKGVKERILTS
jgi:hypothetical protein